MFSFNKRLQYPVKVGSPDPIFARMLQQAIGGVEGEIRVCIIFLPSLGRTWPDDKIPRHVASHRD